MTKDVSSEKSQFLPYLFIVIPVIVSALIAAIAWLANLSDTQRIQAIWTISALILGAMVTVLLRHYELHKAVSDLKKAVSDANTANENIIRTTQRMVRLEQSIKHEEAFERLVSLSDAMALINETSKKHPVLCDLIDWKKERIFLRALDDHATLSKGIIHIDDTNKELNYNEVLLRTLPLKLVRAVSIDDEDFWLSPEGTSMLVAHKEIKDRKEIETRRVFIISKELNAYKDTFKNQIQSGVLVKYIPATALHDELEEDFVLYDDSFVRFGYAATSNDKSSLSNKYACVSVDRQLLSQYADNFQALWLRAKTFDEASLRHDDQ